MARNLEKRQLREHQAELPINQIYGKSNYAEHSNLSNGQFRRFENVEIYSGDPDYFKSRRGSQYFDFQELPFPDVKTYNKVSWTIIVSGTEREYIVWQQGDSFYWKSVTVNPGSYQQIKLKHNSGVNLTVGSATRSDMTLDEDRLLIYHKDGNKVIEFDYDQGEFVGRSMGMKRVYINSVSTTSLVSSSANLSGKYVYGVERCYRNSDNADLLCSGVNRILHRSSAVKQGEYARTGALENQEGQISLASANFFARFDIQASGYVAALGTDVGKTVTFSGSGATGVLRGYDNGNRIWWVDIESSASDPLIGDTLNVVSGTGSGTTDEQDLAQQDYLWTHVKLWRSKNLLPDVTDPDLPVEAFGTEDDMWLVAIITKAELLNSGLAAVATSQDGVLPPGNKYVQAGINNTDMTITDNANDEALLQLSPTGTLELLPFPACNLGTYHAERMWGSQLGDSAWDNGIGIKDDSQNNVFYTPHNILWYKEQGRTDYFLETQKDGQKITKMLSFERDLTITKSDKTLRLPDGDVTLGFEVTDHAQGITAANYGLFVPQLGLVGITSDYNQLKIYGFDHVWRNTLNGIDIARDLREDTESLLSGETSMAYFNGKLYVLNANGYRTGASNSTVHVLNVEQKRGWSDYVYPNANMEHLLPYDGGKSLMVIGRNRQIIKLEVKDLDTDIVPDTGSTSYPVGLWDTFMFRSGDGRHVLEHEYLSVVGKLSNPMTAAPYCNNESWPDPTVEKETLFYPDVDIESLDELKNREYRLYLEPQTIGNFLWSRLVGNFLWYRVKTTAPFTISSQLLGCIIDEDGNAHGGFDPFQNRNQDANGPDWANPSGIYTETGTADNNINETGSQTDNYTEEPD